MASKARRPELDGLRGLAVLLMLGQHLMVWLWNHDPSSPLSGLLVGISAAGGMAAPLFVTLAGCGSGLAYHPRDGADRRPPWAVSLGRAAALWTLATVLSLLTPSWFSLRSFYVLHLLAIGLAIGPWCAAQSRRRLCIAALLVALLTPLVQIGLEVPISIGNRYMSARPPLPGLAGALRDMLTRALVGGHFPLLPWTLPFLLGVAAGKTLRQDGRLPLGAGLLAVGLGAGGMTLAFALPITGESWLARLLSPQVPFFPCSPALCLALCGAALCMIHIAGRVPNIVKPLVYSGRISLTVLMIHLPVYRELSRPIGAWRGLGGEQTLLVIVCSMLFTILIARCWERIDYRYGAEWLVRLPDKWTRR